jgi:hypothetical protein
MTNAIGGLGKCDAVPIVGAAQRLSVFGCNFPGFIGLSIQGGAYNETYNQQHYNCRRRANRS